MKKEILIMNLIFSENDPPITAFENNLAALSELFAALSELFAALSKLFAALSELFAAHNLGTPGINCFLIFLIRIHI
jgi:hypothetical protein